MTSIYDTSRHVFPRTPTARPARPGASPPGQPSSAAPLFLTSVSPARAYEVTAFPGYSLIDKEGMLRLLRSATLPSRDLLDDLLSD